MIHHSQCPTHRQQSALPCQTPVSVKKSLVCAVYRPAMQKIDEVLSIHVHVHVLYVHVVYIPLCIHTVETSQPLVVNTAATVLVPPDPDCLEMEENECVQSFVSCGCGCQLSGVKSCSGQFSLDHFLEFRGQSRS